MLKIRFTRVGRRHDPTFRVIVTDSKKAAKSGAYLENLGFYNPRKKTSQLKEERIKHWISQGAQLSDSVHNLLVKSKIIEGEKIDVSARAKKPRRKVGVPTPPEADVGKKESKKEQPKKEEPKVEEESKKEKEVEGEKIKQPTSVNLPAGKAGAAVGKDKNEEPK